MNLHEGTLWIQYIKCKEKLFLDITLFPAFSLQVRHVFCNYLGRQEEF